MENEKRSSSKTWSTMFRKDKQTMTMIVKKNAQLSDFMLESFSYKLFLNRFCVSRWKLLKFRNSEPFDHWSSLHLPQRSSTVKIMNLWPKSRKIFWHFSEPSLNLSQNSTKLCTHGLNDLEFRVRWRQQKPLDCLQFFSPVNAAKGLRNLTTELFFAHRRVQVSFAFVIVEIDIISERKAKAAPTTSSIKRSSVATHGSSSIDFVCSRKTNLSEEKEKTLSEEVLGGLWPRLIRAHPLEDPSTFSVPATTCSIASFRVFIVLLQIWGIWNNMEAIKSCKNVFENYFLFDNKKWTLSPQHMENETRIYFHSKDQDAWSRWCRAISFHSNDESRRSWRRKKCLLFYEGEELWIITDKRIWHQTYGAARNLTLHLNSFMKINCSQKN